MRNNAVIEPVDYLVIGHITQDIVPNGKTLGGTVSYAALTAKAMGLRVGIVTACASSLALDELDGIAIQAIDSEYTSTFQNVYTPQGRIQYVHHVADAISINHVPETWRNTPVIHLGPIAQEVDPSLGRAFPNSFVGITPQGWLRRWNEEGRVFWTDWVEAAYVLEHSNAVVLSIEDVGGDETRIEAMLASARIMVVTEGAAGARVYWNGDQRRFRPPQVDEIDPVGAGDIFATAFFARCQATRDPWEAARYATLLASNSVTRRGLNGVPTPEEAKQHLVEIMRTI